MAALTASLTVSSVELECPTCGEAIAAPNGSLYIAEHEYEAMPRQLTCKACGAKLRLPAWPKPRAAKTPTAKPPPNADPQLTKALKHLLEE